MSQELDVAVVTPERAVARGKADMVVAPSVMGQVGILPDHRPLLADLDVGIVELRSGGVVERFAISGGFLEVAGSRVTLLVEAAERADTIDVARSKAVLADAEAKLKKLDSGSAEYAEEFQRARRARNRVEAAASV
jgi:F-type H+-transporting ATPase subunit epsilon